MGISVGDVRIVDNSALIKQASKQAIQNALTAIGLSAERHAASICPVDTGRLRNSITSKTEMSENAVYVGTDVNYGKYVELGTYKMAARPFIKPAATDHTSEYKAISERYLKGV